MAAGRGSHIHLANHVTIVSEVNGGADFDLEIFSI